MNGSRNMMRLIIMIICLVATPLISGVFAQSDTTVTVFPEPEIDTSYYVQDENGNEQTEEENYFLSLSPSDTLIQHRIRIPEESVSQLKNEDAFWYANREIKAKNKDDASLTTSQYTPVFMRPWFSTLMWFIIIAVFIGAIIVYLSESQLGLFKRNRAIDVSSAESEPDMPEDIFAINYQKEIVRAETSGDYRLAVRLHYLRLLKSLSERGLIRYQHDKTNMEYLIQLYKTPVYDGFFSATRYYEYSWYGGFPVSAENYELIRQDFEKTENTH